jgi:hypothetical protein
VKGDPISSGHHADAATTRMRLGSDLVSVVDRWATREAVDGARLSRHAERGIAERMNLRPARR